MLALICNDDNLPEWVPLEIFSIETQKIPDNWYFSSTPAEQLGLQAIWGYQRIVVDTNHYDALLERDPLELRYFYEEHEKILQEINNTHLP